jgi:hypothetical protein
VFNLKWFIDDRAMSTVHSIDEPNAKQNDSPRLDTTETHQSRLPGIVKTTDLKESSS